MNIHKLEQRILLNELVNHQSVSRQMLVDALIANGHCGLDPLPAKNSVRAGMLNLRIKCRALGFELFTMNIGGPAGTDYGITEEAYEFLLDNYSEPEYDENGAMVGLTILFPPLPTQEE